MLKFDHMTVMIKAMENGNGAISQIDILDLAVNEIHMFQDLANWIDDVSNVKVACRYLMQHGGEQKIIIPAEHGNFKIGITALLEFKCRIDTAKSSAKDQYARLFHNIIQ